MDKNRFLELQRKANRSLISDSCNRHHGFGIEAGNPGCFQSRAEVDEYLGYIEAEAKGMTFESLISSIKEKIKAYDKQIAELSSPTMTV